MKKVIYLLCVAALMSCVGNSQDKKIRQAVENQMKLYPESTLQDLYKSFFQAEFGAEHIVSDTAAAGRYLDRELSIPDLTGILYEPIGADSSYYRVHLTCVQRGFITRQQLFDAFISGVSEVSSPQVQKWESSWAEILAVIDGMNLELDGYASDRQMIEELIDSGRYAVHHSETFGAVYKPHYRIVRRDIFERCLLPFLIHEVHSRYSFRLQLCSLVYL